MMSFSEKEEKILEYWEKEQIFQKSLEQRKGGKPFVFFEGPPTANGKPGLHHVLTRAFKDVIPRFKTMQGYYVARKGGWDTHGLPVELQIEKKLGISTKKEIEEYGIEKFNALCKESVMEYKADWEKLSTRVAYWLDMNDPYITYKNEYIESLWWILKTLHEKDLMYYGHRVVPQCPRCTTALSSHEVAQGYKLVKDTSVFVKFPVKGEENTFILSWTTTPWTLPGNVALALNPEVMYSLVKKDNEQFYLATDLVESVLGEGVETLKTMKGADLVGKEYTPLFEGALNPGDKKAWYVVPASFVTTTDGTGVVHTAPMYGEEDYALGIALDLPRVHTVDEAGLFLASVKNWAGKFVKSKTVEKEIIADLDSRGLLLRAQDYEHEYPFCWRCDTPLLYYAKASWFIKTTAVKEKLLENNETVNWTPEYIKHGRFGEWLKNVRDWALSRERYWGTPLPIWQCEEGHFTPIGSIEELRTRSKNFSEIYSEDTIDLHRPFVDGVVVVCVQCGKDAHRMKEVIDVWFDSGAMPFCQWHYPFENKDKIDEGTGFPADYISEGIDQTRGWFYTLLAVSTLLGKEAPYKNVISLGLILDKKGQKMSKSKGNVVDPWEVISAHGADALRWHLFTMSQPGEPKYFDTNDVKDVVRKINIMVGNILSFYEMYKSEEKGDIKNPEHILDQWILSITNGLIKKVTSHLESYEIFEAARSIEDFIAELSTWYLRRSRDRFKEGGDDARQAAATLQLVLETLSKLIAPFMPFLADDLYGKVAFDKKQSVHLADWPNVDESLINEGLEEEMKTARQVVEIAHALRSEASINVRQPLARLQVSRAFNPSVSAIIADEVNVKKCEEGQSVEEGFVTRTEGNLTVSLDTTLNEELKSEGLLRELVRHVNALRKERGLTIKDRIILSYETVSSNLQSVITTYEEELKSATLTDQIKHGTDEQAKLLVIKGETIGVNITVV